ncbi:MAG: 16S rRNA (guanine966-N2)-methyltransferase [Parvicellaceae bacterium]|jgi:16S rRNA (guanine966-N2)-methyltransferase
MRVISGKFRSKRIRAPKAIKARPTTDFAKESLFNILNNWFDLQEITVLDLFSGTGNISYEFGSRGAQQILAVDIALASQKFIRKQAEEMELPMTVIKADAFRFVRNHVGQYNVIFADPPYGHRDMTTLPSLILDKNLLKPKGVLIVEHDRDTDFTKEERFLELRKYGKVHFSFFE